MPECTYEEPELCSSSGQVLAFHRWSQAFASDGMTNFPRDRYLVVFKH